MRYLKTFIAAGFCPYRLDHLPAVTERFGHIITQINACHNCIVALDVIVLSHY